MRILVPWIALACCLGAEEPAPVAPTPESILEAARAKHYAVTSAAAADYRASVAETLQFADTAEIYLLDFDMPEEEADSEKEQRFPIHPYDRSTNILNRKKIAGDLLAECRKGTAELLKVREDPASNLCHFPIHGVRFFKGKEMIFESSFCWTCNNFYVEGAGGTHDWIGIGADGLREFLMKEMPVPEKEMERFSAKYGPKKDKEQK